MSPATSEKQAKLFRTALGQKRSGKHTDTPAGKIADTVSEDKIEEFTHTKSLAKQITAFVEKATDPSHQVHGGSWGGKPSQSEWQGSSVEHAVERKPIPEERETWGTFLGTKKHPHAEPGKRTFKSLAKELNDFVEKQQS